MGLTLQWMQSAPAGHWKSDRRLFLNEMGAVVEDGDPAARFLLVAKGGSIPMEVAKQHGLVEEAPEQSPEQSKSEDVMKSESTVEQKHVDGPPETKHVSEPPATKRGRKPTDAETGAFIPLDPHTGEPA